MSTLSLRLLKLLDNWGIIVSVKADLAESILEVDFQMQYCPYYLSH
jgi:hypothetical protein